MVRKRKPRPIKSLDEALTRADYLRPAGLLAMLAAFLMLTFTPQMVFQAVNRSGYTLTEATVLSSPGISSPGLSTVSLRIASTGQEIRVRKTALHRSTPAAQLAIWHNPSAILVFGITLFDQRVVSADNYPELPTLANAFFAVLVNLVVAAVGSSLFFWPSDALRFWHQR